MYARRERFLLIVSLAFNVLLLGILCIQSLPPSFWSGGVPVAGKQSQWLSWELFQKIENGMTLQQVIALVGKPPGIYRNTTEPINWTNLAVMFQSQGHVTFQTWSDDRSFIAVAIDPQGCVVDKGYGVVRY